MVSPDFMCRSMSSSANFFAFFEYLKLTWLKSMEPSFMSYIGFSGLVRVVCSVKTSHTRFADSSAMVIMTNIIESIIRLESIMKL